MWALTVQKTGQSVETAEMFTGRFKGNFARKVSVCIRRHLWVQRKPVRSCLLDKSKAVLYEKCLYAQARHACCLNAHMHFTHTYARKLKYGHKMFNGHFSRADPLNFARFMTLQQLCMHLFLYIFISSCQ